MDAPQPAIPLLPLPLRPKFFQPLNEDFLAPASSILTLPNTRHLLVRLQATHLMNLIFDLPQFSSILRARLFLLELRAPLDKDMKSAYEVRCCLRVCRLSSLHFRFRFGRNW